MKKAPVIFWFRRDLRLKDNVGLAAAINSGSPVIPLFIVDPAIMKSRRFSSIRYRFMAAALASLREQLRKHDWDLMIRHGSPRQVLVEITNETGAEALYSNVDYTPYSRKRDQSVINSLDIPVHTHHDRLLVLPDELRKNDGDPYVVYTPFKNKWRTISKPLQVEYPPINSDTFFDTQHSDHGTLPDIEDDYDMLLPEASEERAQGLLQDFMKEAVFNYRTSRDLLGNFRDEPLTGTSFLSPYIRFGLISLREIYWSAREAYDRADSEAQRDSVNTFINEIIWHEFYTHILWHFPQVKTQNFQEKFDRVEWRSSPTDLQAWKDGMTGYPIVDAAMRQLNQTGWMHNRARMIVASFLTKDLQIDWREGELYFIQNLLDGDLAANNGGWQWAAGSGTDAQPYFRIFNPVSQSHKFDPEGKYIRYWVPELADVPDQYIHAPWEMQYPPEGYPAPIVDHAQARKAVLEAFEVLKI